MEKGSGLRWGCGLCCWCCCWAAAAASGRKGWKRRGGAGRAVGETAGMEFIVVVIPVVGECEPEEAGEDGSGVSVTLISGLGGHDDIMAETASAAEEASFSEWGGLAGSTISTGRLSRLIMASDVFLVSLFLSTRQRRPCLSVGRSSTTSPHENWQRRRGERPTAQ